MVLTLYYDLFSEPCRAVYLFLKINNIQFEACELDFLKGEHMTPELLQKYPFHKIPFIDDDGFILAESIAIMRYLAKKYDVAGHWFGTDNLKRAAKIDEFLCWYHGCLRAPGWNALFPVLQNRGIPGVYPYQPLDVQLLEKGKAGLVRAVKHIDEYFLADAPYIGGEEISVADLMGVSELIELKIANMEHLYTCNAKVGAWVEKVLAYFGAYTAEANVRLGEMKAKFEASD